MSIALLDADIIAYRASVAYQTDWGDGKTSGNLTKSIEEAERLIREWTTKARCQSHVLCFSDEDGRNFRRKVDPSYKAHRKGEKPAVYYDVLKHLEARHRTQRLPWLEADDVMGIMGTSPKLTKPVIVSIDKDMLTVPALVFNPNNMTRPRRIRPAEAIRNWLTQTLTGDSTDGYKGAPGIGPKKAEAILAKVNTLADGWAAVVRTYIERGSTSDEALLNARLSRILQREDYINDKQLVRLWHPTTEEWIRCLQSELPQKDDASPSTGTTSPTGPDSSGSTPPAPKAGSRKQRKSSALRTGKSKSSRRRSRK